MHGIGLGGPGLEPWARPRDVLRLYRVRVIWSRLRACQLAERDFVGSIVKQHDPQRATGMLGPDEMREDKRARATVAESAGWAGVVLASYVAASRRR